MRTTPDDVCTILVYVDDLFIMSGHKKSLTEVAETLKAKYGGITTTEGHVHDYLGIKWDFSTPSQVTLSMKGYVTDLLKKYGPNASVNDQSPLLGKDKRELFNSAVMTLHYLAKRVRPDILAAVSFCALVFSPQQSRTTPSSRGFWGTCPCQWTRSSSSR